MKFAWLALTAWVAVSVSGQTNNGQDALLQAIQRADAAALERLLEGGVSPNLTDEEGVPALMLASLFADIDCIQLLLDRGADPNQPAVGGATALMWAIPDIAKAQLLLEHGAQVNATSRLGLTPLLVASGYPRTGELLELLLSYGASLDARDRTGFSALATAMASADVEVLRFLIKAGMDPNGEIAVGAARAAYARPRPDVVDYMLSQDLPVPADSLVNAANWQSPDLVERLIERGAQVDVRRVNYGRTPLLTAASSELAGPGTLRLLLERGADPNAETTEGERPLDWALYGGDPAKISVLLEHGATRGNGPRRDAAAPPSRDGNIDPAVAVGRSVGLLLESSPPIYERGACFSCHHNTLPAEAAALARSKGVPVDNDLARENVEDILTVFRQAVGPMMQGLPAIPGGTVLTVGYGLAALAAHGHPLDKATAAMTHWILATQMPDGSWPGNGISQPPIESSTVSHTTVAVRALSLYPISARRTRIDRALADAQRWLLAVDTASAEERAMRLMGLVWTGAPRAAVEAAAAELLAQQTPSGGWPQLARLDPDAYATGISLATLREAGIPVTGEVYQSGVRFLLNTQYPDGSWRVRSRAFPAQPYFESGFPFGRHQWISAAATAWAAMAIAHTLPGSEAAE